MSEIKTNVVLASCCEGRYAIVQTSDTYEVRIMLGANAGHVLDSLDTLSAAHDRLELAERAHQERERRHAAERQAQRQHIARRRR